MDPKVTREIIKTSEILKNKFRTLKRGLQDIEEVRQTFFTPVSQPLEDIKESLKLKEETSQSSKKIKTKNDEIYKSATTPIPSASSPPFEPFPIPEIRVENEEEEEEQMTDSIVERSPQQKNVEENLHSFGNQHRKYLEKLLRGDKKNLDSHYGIRVMPDGGFAIGDSTDIQLHTNSDDITINGVIYEGTEGLLQLLYLKNPEKYEKKDLEMYKKILISTNAHKKGYSEELGRHGNRSEKYRKVIATLFTPTALKPSGPSLRSQHKGTGLMRADKPIYEYWDDPNELVDRLRVLLSSANAGHQGHMNEIESIIEELREINILY